MEEKHSEIDKICDIKIEEIPNDFNFRNKTYFSDIYDLRMHIKSEIFEKIYFSLMVKVRKRFSCRKSIK